MIYENVFNCDVPNFEMYRNRNQNGLFVLPDKNLHENLIFSLLERNHVTGKHTGRYLNFSIDYLLKEHHNHMFPHLWFLKCKLMYQGFSDFLLNKGIAVFDCKKVDDTSSKLLIEIEVNATRTTHQATTQNTKHKLNAKKQTTKKPQHEN